MITIVGQQRLLTAKRAFSTRRVAELDLRATSDIIAPRAGDVVLARVKSVGRLQRLELTTGRKAALYEGDEVIVAYGARYAPDAYEAEVPGDLGPCQLAAAGGIAGRVLSCNAMFQGSEAPTELEPIGVFVDAQDCAINLRNYALKGTPMVANSAAVIAVCGASMNSGKTTTVSGIVRGLARQGWRVGAAKITGTAAGNDLWKFGDAGAAEALDFTDFGMATTYLAPISELTLGAMSLVHELRARGAQAIVLEIADGVHQRETRALIEHPEIQALVNTWVFAADSAASTAVGLDVLARNGLSAAAVSGLVTASPLAMREAEGLTAAPFLPLAALETGDAASSWVTACLGQRAMAL